MLLSRRNFLFCVLFLTQSCGSVLEAQQISFHILREEGPMTARSLVSQGQAGDSPLVIKASPNVDEELFLLNELRLLYDIWPKDKNATKLLSSLESVRQRVTLLQNAINANHLDPGVAQAYSECIRLIDVNEAYLRNIGVINQQVMDGAKEGAMQAGLDGILEGVKGEVKGDTGDAILGNVVASVLISVIKKGWTVSRERQAGLDREQQKVDAQVATALDTAKAAAHRLTLIRGWGAHESGFDPSSATSAAELVMQRPRDPFVLFELAEEGVDSDNSAADALKRTRQFIQAAELIPDGPYYAPFRLAPLQEAVDFGVDAVGMESTGDYVDGPTPSTPYAWTLVRTYFSVFPNDSDHFGHYQLARVLAVSGRYAEAIAAADNASEEAGVLKLPAFDYRYAKLMSLTGSTSKVANWLTEAYSAGWNDIEAVRTSKDFENFRRSQPSLYKQLTTVNLRKPEFKWGVIRDDIVIHNDSPFEITNLRAKIFIGKGQQTPIVVDVKCKSIASGESCTSENAVSVPGNSFDGLNWTYDCDQMPR
jgi:hypothetical protein